MIDRITVVGTVATEPKLVQNGKDLTICAFKLASNQSRYDRDSASWKDGETNWFKINLFRSLATNAMASIAKGDRVVVAGKLKVRQWEQDGKFSTFVEIEAESVGHDLLWGTSSFQKNVRQRTDAHQAESHRSDSYRAEAAQHGTDQAVVNGETADAEPIDRADGWASSADENASEMAGAGTGGRPF